MNNFETLNDCRQYLQARPIKSWKKKIVMHREVYGLWKLKVSNVKNSFHYAFAVLNDEEFKWFSDFDHWNYYFCDNNGDNWYVISWKEEGDDASLNYIKKISIAPNYVIKWNESKGGNIVGDLYIKNTHHRIAAWKLLS
jgi:hypothetical protein